MSCYRLIFSVDLLSYTMINSQTGYLIKEFNTYMRTKVLILLSLITFGLQAQSQQVFTTVPVVNNKVVFQQFIHVDDAFNTDQRYSLLYKWGKDNYTGNPLLAGIRFDDKKHSVTVSSKVELLLPENSEGVREKVIMSYRFDVSVAQGGCALVVRDISYHNPLVKGSSLFAKSFSAESTITNDAISSAEGRDREYKLNLQKGTLYFLNELHEDISSLFVLNK